MSGTDAGASPAPAGDDGWVIGRAAVLAAWRRLVGRLDPDDRLLVLQDTGFADWPLDDPELLAHWTAWLRLPGRQIRLLGTDFEGLARCHPRFAGWRRHWTHAVSVLQPQMADGRPEMPWHRCAVHRAGALDLVDPDHWRARWHADGASLLHRSDAIAQRCAPAWAAHPLGL